MKVFCIPFLHIMASISAGGKSISKTASKRAPKEEVAAKRARMQSTQEGDGSGNTPDILELRECTHFCNGCFDRLHGSSLQLIKEPATKKTECYRVLLNHFEMLNNNYRAYKHAEENSVAEAVSLLKAAPVANPFAVMYNFPFDHPSGNAESFASMLSREICPAFAPTDCCKDEIDRFCSLHTMVFLAAGHLQRLDRGEAKVRKHGHLNYYSRYRELLLLLNARASSERLACYINENAEKMNRQHKRTPLHPNLYDTAIAKLLASPALTENMYLEMLSPYTGKRLAHMNANTLYHLIVHEPKIEMCRAVKKLLVGRLLLSNGWLARENIYNLFRLYNVLHKVPVAHALKFCALVAKKIRNLSEAEKLVYSRLHESMILQVALPLCKMHYSDSERIMLLCGLKGMLPAAQSPIEEMMHHEACTIFKSNTPEKKILPICIDVCKAGCFRNLNSFLCNISRFITVVQAHRIILALSKAFGRPIQVSHRLAILYELVKTGAFNSENHSCTIQLVANSAQAAATYALALSSYIHTANLSGQPVAEDIEKMHAGAMECYSKLTDSSASEDGCLLKAYGLFLDGYSRYIALGKPCDASIFSGFGSEFYLKLWKCLGKNEELSVNNPCYSALYGMKMFTFLNIHSYFGSKASDLNAGTTSLDTTSMDTTSLDEQVAPSKNECNPNSSKCGVSSIVRGRLLNKVMANAINTYLNDLIQSRIPIDRIFVDFLGRAVSYKTYLLSESIVIYSRLRCRALSISGACAKHEDANTELLISGKRGTICKLRGRFNRKVMVRTVHEAMNVIGNVGEDMLKSEPSLKSTYSAFAVNSANLWFSHWNTGEGSLDSEASASENEFDEKEAEYVDVETITDNEGETEIAVEETLKAFMVLIDPQEN